MSKRQAHRQSSKSRPTIDPFAGFLNRALMLHRQGELAEAAKLYEYIVARDATHFDAAHMLGVVHLQSDRITLGIAFIEQALSVRHNDADAWANLGSGQNRLGLHAAALASFENAIQLKPDNANVHYNLGITLAKLGRHADALTSYERALGLNPAHAEALNGRGNALRALGRCAEAIASFDQALSARPDFADALNNRGLAFAASGQYTAALHNYDQALVVRPNYPEALNNRGNALKTLGRIDEALRSFDQALALRPAYAEAANNRGNALHAQGHFQAALTAFEQALQIRPDYADAMNNRGLALAALRRHGEALASYEGALTLRADYPEALNNRGNTLSALGQHVQALRDFERALTLRPDYVDALNNAASTLLDLGRPDDALLLIDQVLTQHPGHAAARDNHAQALIAKGRFDEAIAEYDTLLEVHEENAGMLANRGRALAALLRYDEAFESYARAIAQQASHTASHNNLGLTCALLNRYDEALMHYARALTCEPEHAGAHVNKSVVHLVRGEWQEGFALYEWRWRHRAAEVLPAFSCPRWNGSDSLQGRRILLWSEQGFGDTLLTCRYASEFATRGAEVILAVQPALAALLRSQTGVSQVVVRDTPWTAEIPTTDFHCPLMSAPHLLGTTPDSIPGVVPYLHAPSDRLAVWRERIAQGQRPGSTLRIGICCSGNPQQANDHNRSTSLARFAPLLREDISLFLIQKDLREEDAAFLRVTPQIRDLRSDLHDFGDTAAAMECLDLIISVDTSVAHLAGALGRPLWVLLSYAADWRWLLDREDNPWFPSARLFRQPVPGDWNAVMANLNEALDSDGLKSRA